MAAGARSSVSEGSHDPLVILATPAQSFLGQVVQGDWSKQDVELADEMGRSTERIRKIRQELGAPKSKHHRRERQTAVALQWAKHNLDKLKGLSRVELGHVSALNPKWGGCLYQLLTPLPRDGRINRKHPWDLMNLRLPNRDLERIWKLPYNSAESYRWRKRRPPPSWCFNRGRASIKVGGWGELQAYHRTVKSEKRKAARYFAQGP